MIYLLDSNTLIQAKNVHYQMSFAPGFWAWLDQGYADGALASILPVYDELCEQKDELAKWAKDSRKSMFLPIDDEETQLKLAEVSEYVAGNAVYGPIHIGNFLGKADPWLVAKAATMGATVVTQEVWAAPNSTKPKIPNVCDQFGVAYCNIYDALNALHAKFVLA